jgi:hypothetical protein
MNFAVTLKSKGQSQQYLWEHKDAGLFFVKLSDYLDCCFALFVNLFVCMHASWLETNKHCLCLCMTTNIKASHCKETAGSLVSSVTSRGSNRSKQETTQTNKPTNHFAATGWRSEKAAGV